MPQNKTWIIQTENQNRAAVMCIKVFQLVLKRLCLDCYSYYCWLVALTFNVIFSITSKSDLKYIAPYTKNVCCYKHLSSMHISFSLYKSKNIFNANKIYFFQIQHFDFVYQITLKKRALAQSTVPILRPMGCCFKKKKPYLKKTNNWQ